MNLDPKIELEFARRAVNDMLPKGDGTVTYAIEWLPYAGAKCVPTIVDKYGFKVTTLETAKELLAEAIAEEPHGIYTLISRTECILETVDADAINPPF